MGGWILYQGDPDQVENGLTRFIHAFSHAKLPPLNTKTIAVNRETGWLLWNWSLEEVDWRPMVLSGRNRGSLLLDGYIKDYSPLGIHDNGACRQFSWQQLQRTIEQNHIGHLNGSFSFTEVNEISGEVIAVVDRIASRPIWFSVDDKVRIWGNFPLAVALFRMRNTIDPAGMWSLLATSRPVGNRSLFKDVLAIPSGSVARFPKVKPFSVESWFNLEFRHRERSARQWGGDIADALRESAQFITKEPGRNYLFLSGGMDSRVAAAAFGPDLVNVTLTTTPNMNSRIAGAVSEKLGQQQKVLIRDPYCYLDTFPAAALIAGGNYNIKHAHFIWPVMRIRNEDAGAAFLLGDMLENFNKHYFKPDWAGSAGIRPDRIAAIFHRLYSFSSPDPDSLRAIFQPGAAAKLENAWKEELTSQARRIRRVSGNDADYLDALFRWANTGYCPTNLMHECMKPFAPVRNVMYDNDLLDMVLGVPPELKKRGVLHREILRHLHPALLWIPNSNSWLPPLFPKSLETATRKARPFIGRFRRWVYSYSLERRSPVVKTEGSWHMLHEWYGKDEHYRNFVDHRLRNVAMLAGDLIDGRRVQSIWENFLHGDHEHTYMIDALLSLALVLEVVFPEGIK